MIQFLLVFISSVVNTLRPRQNGRHFADDTFKCIFMNQNVNISFKISLKVVPRGPINNIPALVQIMAWRRQGDKPLSEPMMIRLLTHICVTRPQWVKHFIHQQRSICLEPPDCLLWLGDASLRSCGTKSHNNLLSMVTCNVPLYDYAYYDHDNIQLTAPGLPISSSWQHCGSR